jgi:hypothetical protein
MKYLVEHMQGTAGINETEIETVEIEATTARAAIELATNDRDGDGWHWDGDTLDNDSSSNRAGSYCDYWMATEVAPDLLAEVERLTAVNKDLSDALEMVMPIIQAHDEWKVRHGQPMLTVRNALKLAGR